MEKPMYLEYLKSSLKVPMFVDESGLRTKFLAIIYSILLTEISTRKESKFNHARLTKLYLAVF
jgi:hypothetical protein